MLLIGDLLALYAGLFVAAAVRFWRLTPGDLFATLAIAFFWLFALAAVTMFIVGLYDIGRSRNSVAFFQKIGVSAAIWTLLGVIYFYINPRATLTPKTLLVLTTIFGFGLLALWRFLYNRFLSTTIWQTTVAFAGITPEVEELIELFAKEPERGFITLGVIGQAAHASALSATTLRELVSKTGGRTPEIIVIAPHLTGSSTLNQELYQVLFKQVGIIELAAFYETVFRRVPPFTFSESWFVTHLSEQRKKMYDRFRFLADYTAGFVMAAITIVTFPLVALGIKLTSSGPIFFKQERVGRGGKKFFMHKYRTMQALTKEGSAELSGPQWASHNDSRITPFGKFLRRTRIDEWPQFVNLLRGDMSLIGPRPERPEFVQQLTGEMPFYMLRHLIKPGLTGWAQLQRSYYGSVSENLQKLEYDLYYVKNRGAWLDLAITLRTLSVLATFSGR